VSVRVLPGGRERAWLEAYHCAALCIAGLVPKCARTDFPHDGAAGSVDVDWGEGGYRNPAAARAVLVSIVLGGTTEGWQGWEWGNWPIDAGQMAEGAVGDALMARELFDHFEMIGSTGATCCGRPTGSAAARTSAASSCGSRTNSNGSRC
jgi:hypothetical protein